MKTLPTQQRLKELLDYDPETGDFHWKQWRGYTAKTGAKAGSINNGYIQIYIDGVPHKAHHLAWIYHHGCNPKGKLDHWDCNEQNNRILNLREATSSQNNSNRNIQKNNTSGVKGVFWHKGTERWSTQVKSNGKTYGAGYHKSIEAAKLAVENKRLELHGEFANNG